MLASVKLARFSKVYSKTIISCALFFLTIYDIVTDTEIQEIFMAISPFIIASISADGFIARNSSHLSLEWTSKEDTQFFVKRTKQAGVIVMGLNTYKTIGKPLPERLNIVYSNTEKNFPGAEVTEADPGDLLADLEKRGYKEVAICGGSSIYTMFMERRLIKKLYLTIEPVVFGEGLKLFQKEIDAKLDLRAVEKLNDNTVLLEYNIQ
ncbi:MAG: hypothetical protein A2748_02600 [Candidatus Wildermuthbacteria bacterium RIFCSPHIGHO2_01_FULL_45_20]|uniref:DHFR domain-containing protein n=1 Tax=Candidatus Wildermuthbacteria bacterium RIFCSPHIGHO2_02_FULL_45_25 TaxID=1802450 RepID=A0A1G2QX98_9BACT|nr:MAG: hypothetical protein A2748_02600 [Candidatus Wildermuthbacteria bacterium RIFCSPHIGHO2_01_FULL_45_20]OHA65254.1 MAG: hypothetical protein A3C04_03025 [Candidatus Wildermuthbacteria bacterium RIFCSPHIGHO2_02_FULL_45_25]